MVKQAMRLVLVMSAASLLFACGGEKLKLKSGAHVWASKSLPQAVQCSEVATVAAGMYHTVGLKEDGTVETKGYTGFGENATSWSNIKAIAAGTFHTVGLKEDGTVVATGYDGFGQVLNISPWSNIKAVAAGLNHTVGLKEDGTVVVVGNISKMDVSPWSNIKAIAAGTYHTVGLKEDGTVVAVGDGDKTNDQGQLNVSSWSNIKAIAAGTYHTVGLKEDGTVVAVGLGFDGQQQNVFPGSNIKAIAAGGYHTIGLKNDGTVVAVGDISQQDVSHLSNIKAIAAGWYHMVALNEDGTVAPVGPSSWGETDITSWTNIMPICDSACVANKDVISPITTAMITGTLGNNGWYRSDVQMTLTATDNDGGSGVKEIHYSVDDTGNIASGSSATVSIAGDGPHAVTWYAIDNAGNIETPPQMRSINIDKTPPSILSLSANPSILWPPNHKIMNVVIGGSAADADSGSGIDSTIITVTDEYGIYNMTVPGFGSAVPLESWRAGTDMNGRLYTITAVTTDKAGNQSKKGTTTVLVPHDMRQKVDRPRLGADEP